MATKSAVSLIVFITLTTVGLTAAGTALSYSYDFAAATDDDGERRAAAVDAEIAVISDPGAGAAYDDDAETLTLLVKNLGRGTLPDRPEAFDLTVDGEHVPVAGTEVVGGGDWREDGVVRLRASTDLALGAHRVRVLVRGGHGLFSFVRAAASARLSACPGGGSTLPAATRVDDFEDGANLTEYAGDVAAFVETEERASVGRCSLGVRNRSTAPAVRSLSGLPTYPTNGTSFEFGAYRTNASSAERVGFGRQSGGSGYAVGLDRVNDTAWAVTLADETGTVVGRATTGERLAGAWYRVRLDWGFSGGTGDGHVEAVLFAPNGTEVARATMTDATLGSGGVSYAYGNRTRADTFLDGVRVTKRYVDDFEDGDLSEYANAGSATASAAAAYHGDRGFDSDGSFAYTDGTSLVRAPDQGEVTEYYFLSGGSFHPEFRFGVEKDTAYYGVYYATDGTVAIENSQRQGGGSVTVLNSTTAAPPTAGKWYEGRVNWTTGGTITYTVTDPADGSTVATVRATDTTHTDGGVGYYGGGGDTFVDWVHVNATASN